MHRNRFRVALPCAVALLASASVATAQTVQPVDLADLASGAEQRSPAVAFDGGHHLLAWEEDGVVWAALRTVEGAPAGNRFAVDPAGTQREPAVAAASSGGFLVVWTEIEANGDANVHGARVSASGIVGTSFLVSAIDSGGTPAPAPGPQELAAVAASGNDFLVVWQDGRATTGGPDIHGALLTAAGLLFDVVVTQTTTAERRPALAWDGLRYLIVWEDHDPAATHADLWGRAFSASGAPGGLAFQISAATGDERRPAVSSSGKGHLVTWTDPSSGTARLVAVTVDDAGNLGAPTPLAAVDAAAPHAVASGGLGHLVAYQRTTSGTLGTRITANGVAGLEFAIDATGAVTPGQALSYGGRGRFLEVHRTGTTVSQLAAFLVTTSERLDVARSGTGTGKVASEPAAIQCGTTCTAEFTTDTVVTLTATPDAGSAFDGWSGCDSALDATCTVTMSAAQTVTATFTSAPPGPAGAPTYTDVGATSVTVTWSAADGATGHELERSPEVDGAPAGYARVAAGAITTYVDANRSPNTSYWYRARGTNPAGPGPDGIQTSVTTLPGTPGTPTFPSVGSTSATVNWTAPAGGATSYALERAPSSGTEWTRLDPVTGLSHVDSPLAAGTTYRYRVRAIGDGGAGAYSAEASVTTLPLPPATPGQPTVSGVEASKVTVSWIAVDGATTYDLERAPAADGTFTAVAPDVAATTHVDATVTPNATFWYRLVAKNAGGSSAPSAAASVRTLPGAPGAPVLSGVTTTEITVNWTAPDGGADGYEVERATSAGTDWAPFAPTPDLTLTDTGLTPGTTYQYRVRATNATGPGDYSAAVSVTTTPLPPAAPAAPTYGSIGATSVHVSWIAVEGATSYELQRRPGPDGTWTVVATDLATTTKLDEALSSNATYWYQVRGTNSGGDGPFSQPSSVTTLPGTPGTPTFPTITATGVTVTWTAPGGGATTYKLERADSTGTWSEIAPALATTAFSDGSLASNATYRYRVRATNATGDGAYSPEASVTTLPAAPGMPTFGSVTETSLVVSWTAPGGGAETYEVQRSPTGTDAWNTIASSVTTLSQPDSGLAAGTTYWYRVRALTGAGASTYSTPAQVTTRPGAPGTPVLSGATTTAITVTWTAPASGAEAYEVWRATSGGTDWVLVAPTPNLTLTDTGLTPGTTYQYRVRATNASGPGAYSATSSVTTVPLAPAAPTYGSIGATSVQVSWLAVEGATGYELQRGPGPDDTWTVVAAGVTTTTTLEEALSPNTTYWYRVRGSSSGGEGTFSAASSVTTLPGVPGTPTFPIITSTGVTVTWTAPAGGATTYKLERAGSTGTWTEIAPALASTSFPDGTLASNATYRYRVRASNGSGDGTYSAEASVTTLPGAPGTPTFGSVTETSLVVSWTAPAGGAETYDIERSPTGTDSWTTVASGVTAPTQPDSGLAVGTTYWYRVLARTQAGASAYSTPARVITLPGAPGTPVFTNVGATSTTVSWSAAVGAASYRIERAADDGGAPSGAWEEIASGVTSPPYASTGLASNATYWYRVRATNASGNGTYSAAAPVTTLPAAPGTPAYTGVSTSSLTVSWTAPSGGASSYHVERASSATGTFTLVGNPSGLSHAETGLASGTTYWYRVRAVTSTGVSAYSAASQVITLPLAPGTPTFSSIGTTAVTVGWTAPVGAAAYRLERAPDSGSNAPGAWTEIQPALKATTFTDTGRAANTRYWYRVRATNASGDGDYSAHAGVTTRPNAPGGPTFSDVTTTGMRVSWSAPSGGAASYDLERGTSANGTWTVLATATTALSYLDSGLAPGTTYWYRVRAANADGLYGAYATASRPTLPEAPAAPTFSDVASFSLTVSWVAVTGATSYKLERALDDGTGAAGTWTELAAGITVTSRAEATLTADTRYWYRLRATNASGDSAYSGASAVITLPTGPGKPTFSSITSTSVLVSWTAPPEGAASYELERALSASGPWTAVATGMAALERADSGLASGTTYYYRVRAANADGAFGPWSQVGWATTLPGIPGAPTYSQISTVSLTVHWTEITGATTYHVERALDAAGKPGTWELVAEGLSFNYYNDATAPNTTYWYRVRGANESGYGSYSPASSVTTLANAPGAPTFSNVATTSVTVSWTAPTGGAASYVVERAPALTGPWAEIKSGVAALTYPDTGLAPDTVYWYRIRATNASGATGSPGTPASVRTLPAAPATAPGTPTYANVGTGSVTVSWTDTSTATSWKLERAPDAGNVHGAWTPIATVSTKTYADAALAPNTAYWYRVLGSTAGGDGPYSDPSRMVTLPLAPGAPTFGDVLTASVSVSWAAPAGGAATYQLERASSAAGPWAVVIGGTASLTHLDTGLSANTTYHYRVRAANVAGAHGAYSPAASVTTAPDWTVTAPDAPGAPTYSTVRATSVAVSWSGSAGAESYTLERAGDAGGAPDGAWAVVTTVTWTSVIDSGRLANSVYWYRVRATNAGGDSAWSAPTQVMTAPNAPGAPSFSAVAATTLNLSWTVPPGGAATYVVERASASIGPWVQVAAGLATTSYDDRGLTGNQTYHYRVRAANLAGAVGAPSASKAVLTAADSTAPLPPAPGTPTFPAIAASYVKVAWGAVSGAASYLLERAPASTGSWTQIASVTATTFTDTGRAPNTTYWYRVRGSSGGGYGPYSNAASAMTAPTAPGAPTFSAVGVGTLTVSWTAPASGAASYEVERALSALGPWAEVAAGVTSTRLDDARLTGNTTYHYRVRATNASGVDGVYSVARSVTTTADATTASPGAPGVPTFASVTATSLGITWTAAPDATSYELERATVAGGPFTRIAAVTATSFTDTWRSPNTAYWYRVRGANAGGFGPYSAERGVITAPGAPGAPTFPTVEATAVTLSWAAPAGGAATYEVERSTAAYGPWAQIAQGIAGTSLVDGGLTGSTTYYYRVRAANLEGTDGWYSSTRSVTTLADPATLPPGQPGAPVYASVTASWLRLSWTSAPGATSYEVDRALDASGSLAWSTIARGLTATAYTDTGRSANTKYWYRVRGANAGGSGTGSPETSVITAPNAPGAPSFTQIGSASVTASWAAPSGGAASYAVERATSLLGPWSTVAGGVLVTVHADRTVAGNTTYHYRIRAANASGLQGLASSVASVTTEPDAVVAVPAAPAPPAFPVVTSTWLSVSWTAVADAAGYQVERADASTGPWTEIASTASTSHTDFGRAGNTSYWYRIRAWNAGGEGDHSGASRITTAPGTPGVPSFSAVGPSTVTLTWAAPAGGAASYGIERATSASGPWVSLARVSALEHTDTTVTGNATYHYRIRARNADGLDGGASVAASVTTPADPAVAPAGAAGPITVSGVWTSWVDLSWTGATGATLHELERAPDASGAPGSWGWIASVTTTAHRDLGRAANTRYWYRVRGSSAGGYGPYSDPKAVLTAPNAPGAPTFSAIGTAEVTVSWTAPPGGAATYALERATSSAGPWTIIAPGLTALTHEDGGLAASTAYWYRVRAANVEGASGPYSLVRAVTTAAVPGS